ncbi:hypothetical protein BH09SUM1_BH09SUM1_14000 [soil metagenome]
MANSVVERPVLAQILIIAAALTCGVGVWFVVQITAREEMTLSIDIKAENLPPEVDLQRISPEKADVKFSYPATEIGKMKGPNFTVEVDFSDLKDLIAMHARGKDDLADEGQKVLTLNNIHDTVNAATSNLTPMSIPPQVTWQARLRSARAVIEPVVTGTAAEGYEYSSAKAMVDGPGEIIVLLNKQAEDKFKAAGDPFIHIKTQPVDVTGKFGLVREQVDLQLPEGVSMLPGDRAANRVVLLELTEKFATRVIENVPVVYHFLVGDAGLVAHVSPAQVNVSITGPVTAVNAITPEMIGFSLSGVAERAGERSDVPVEARITDPALRVKIAALQVTPGAVSVEVEDAREGSPGALPTSVAHDRDTSPSAAPPAPR